MRYIRKSRNSRCFLCDLIRARTDRRNLVLHRGRTALVLMNRYPYNGGHLMVAPLRHVDTLAALSAEEQLEIMQLTVVAMEVLGRTLRPHGFNVGLNLGEAAGAGLKDHLHLHIVPRWNGDTNFMPVMAELKVIPQALDAAWRQFRAAWPKAGRRGRQAGRASRSGDRPGPRGPAGGRRRSR